MINIWSDKKSINIIVNVLLFLISINIFHFGQLILPIICLILFIDNRLKFKVNNIKTFIILCLFAIVFFAFSYKLGFYSVMGFCFPMAYYIGSNAKNINEDNAKKAIYLIAFGMAIHATLNMVYDFSVYGIYLFKKINHYDFWTRDTITQAVSAANCLLIISFFYYLINYENNKKYKIIGLVLFSIVSLYNIGLGRRTPLFLLFVTFAMSLLADALIFKSKAININLIKKIILCLIVMTIILVICYFTNFLNIGIIIQRTTLFEKFMHEGLSSGRIQIFIDSLKYLPTYIWGGQYISNELGIQIHNLWLDTYDYAGILSCLLIVAYTVLYAISAIKLLKNKNITNNFKVMLLEIYFVTFFLMLAEPAMTSLSLFIICSIILQAILEKLII